MTINNYDAQGRLNQTINDTITDFLRSNPVGLDVVLNALEDAKSDAETVYDNWFAPQLSEAGGADT